MASSVPKLSPLPSKFSQETPAKRSARKSLPNGTQKNEKTARDKEVAQQELDNIKNELKSKQRLIDNLKQSLKDVPKQMQDEVYNRDRYIDELNKRILEFQTQKIETEAQRFQELEQTVSTLTKKVKELTNENEELHEKLLDAQQDSQRFKNEFIDHIESREQEVSSVKLTLADQQQDAEKTQSDSNASHKQVLEVAIMLKAVTSINATLNGQILKVNAALDEETDEKYKYRIKAASADELERRLFDKMNENLKLINKVDKIEKAANAFKDCYDSNIEKLKNIENILASSVLEEHHIIGSNLTDVRREFNQTLEQQQKTLKKEPGLGDGKQNINLQSKNIEIQKLRLAEKVHIDRIAELDAFAKSLQAQMKEYQLSVQQRIETNESKTSSTFNQMNDMKAKFEAQGYALNQANNKLASLQSMQSLSRQRLEQKDQRIEQVEEELGRLREQMASSRRDTQSKEKELRERERSIMQKRNVMQSYEDELAARDNILMQKTGQLARIEESAEENGKQRGKKNSQISAVGTRKARKLKEATFDRYSERLETEERYSESSRGHVSELNGSSKRNQLNGMFRNKHASTGQLLAPLKKQISASVHDSEMSSVHQRLFQNKMYLPDLTTESGNAGNRSPTKNCNNEPLYKIVNNYIARIEEAKRWKNSKHAQLRSHKSYKTSSMRIGELQSILEMQFPEGPDMDPIYALEQAYSNKVSGIKETLQNRLNGIVANLQVKELLQHVRYEKLMTALQFTTEVNIYELLKILEDYAN